ncbi:MAG: asparagine synthase (glutamine-hydrolyzing) [Methylophilus sp.]
MCGIAGALNLKNQTTPPASVELLSKMISAVTHRGPDEFGLYRDQKCALVHARLSIVDLASGQQPMPNTNNTSYIVFNGEIFNHVELRKELESLGHTFRTHSDTEVALAAWEQWGESAINRFNGQFAIAIWDTLQSTLTLVRDFAGILPLYYTEHAGRLLFASEVKSIFADPSITREFNPVGLDQLFTFWGTVAPQTVFAGISELPPGHIRQYSPEGVREWALPNPFKRKLNQYEQPDNIEDAIDAVSSKLIQATKLRLLRADVPVGAYLSGGLDSSLIAAMAAHCTPQQLNTFSLQFEDTEFDETEFQTHMVKKIGCKHTQLTIKHQDIADSFEQVIFHTEKPLLRTAAAPMFLLSKMVKQSGIKVVLTGEGADEVFGGYDLFREAKVRRFWAKQPNSSWRPHLLERLYPYLARSPVSEKAMAQRFFGQNLETANDPGFSHGPRWTSTSTIKRLFSQEYVALLKPHHVTQAYIDTLPSEFKQWPKLSQDQYIEWSTLFHGYLICSQGDRMLMGNSVEGRFPFLDPEVVSLAAQLPSKFKINGLDEKHVLKKIALNWIPESIVNRSKQPYRAPDTQSFLDASVVDRYDALLSEDSVKMAGVFDEKAVARLWSKARSKTPGFRFSNTDNMAIVGIISTQILYERFIAKNASHHYPSPVFKTFIDRLAH